MNRPQQSIKLKQISRIISRQRDEEVTSSCVSIVVILFIIFITGVIMIISGAVVYNDCWQSWLPTWLIVRIIWFCETQIYHLLQIEGCGLLILCLVTFCSDSENVIVASLSKVVFVALILVNIWCSVGRKSSMNFYLNFSFKIAGIFWTADNDECGENFGLLIKCLFAGSFLGIARWFCLYCCNNKVFFWSGCSNLLVWLQFHWGPEKQTKEKQQLSILKGLLDSKE